MRRFDFVDVTLRDAHQCLWSTRMTTAMMTPILAAIDRVGYAYVNILGGAVFDVCVRYLHENPRERVGLLRAPRSRALGRVPGTHKHPLDRTGHRAARGAHRAQAAAIAHRTRRGGDLLVATFYDRKLIEPLPNPAPGYSFRTMPLNGPIRYVGARQNLEHVRIRFAGTELTLSGYRPASLL